MSENKEIEIRYSFIANKDFAKEFFEKAIVTEVAYLTPFKGCDSTTCCRFRRRNGKSTMTCKTSDGKNVKFTTLTQEVNTLIKDGKDAVSPVVTMSSTASELSITVVDVEGTKTETVEKGMTLFYQDLEPTVTDTTVWIK